MVDNVTHNPKGAPDVEAVARAHAVYTPLALTFYDVIVHGLSNRFAWRCPTSKLVALYRDNLSENHLEAGVGTGLFLDRTGDHAKLDRLVLLDINRHCLDRAARRLARFHPTRREANLLEPLTPHMAPFQSIGLTYVLHCLPGNMSEKLSVLDHLRPMMADRCVLFGATILGRGVTPNLPARALLDVYNKKGVFNNRADDIESLRHGLEQRFGTVEIEPQGCVALFRAA
ncbi:MAG: class I SAM-dependent methyltransferase [Hyphomicrobiales bacterium]